MRSLLPLTFTTMHPMRFQGIEPWTFDRQGTTHDPQARAVALDLAVLVPHPATDGWVAMPRGIVSDQHCGVFDLFCSL